MKIVDYLDTVINHVIELYKNEHPKNEKYKLDVQNLINEFVKIYQCDLRKSEILVSSIIDLTVNDLTIGKTHYTKKADQTLEEFRDNEIALRLAAESRAKNKNLIDQILFEISGDVTETVPRLTNLTSFSAYIDRLITERIKQFNFNIENRVLEYNHQEILSNYICNDIDILLSNTLTNGYFYIGEKRTFDEPELIKSLKEAK
jgi:hypothetical protein